MATMVAGKVKNTFSMEAGLMKIMFAKEI